MQYFNIQVASQLSGVASATIRAWEKRYNAVVPERAENKHRLYSETDIEKLALLFKLTEFGQSIGKIAHLDLNELKDVYTTLLHRPYDEKQVITPYHDRMDLEKILRNLYLALASYKLDIISHELEKAKNNLSPRELCLNILIPLFNEIGNKVSRNELSIAQEHALSAVFYFHIGQMVGLHYQTPVDSQRLILITTPEGEHHEMGILGAALLCVHYGVRFIYLGSNLPADALSEAANALQSNAVLIGVSRGNGFLGNKTLEEYLEKLNHNLKQKTDIWIGGNIKPYNRTELEKRNITFFPTLHALDEFLDQYRVYSHL
jgi:DNA-binding transcriptional MerR regulator